MPLLAVSRRVRLLSRLAALSALGLVGCSLLQNVSGVQCSQTSDCELLGSPFQGTVCRRSFCVTPDVGSGGGTGLGGGNGACTSNSECIDAPENFGEPAACIAGSCVPLKTGEECPWVLGLGENLENLRKPEPIIIGAYAPIESIIPTDNAHMLNYEFAIDEMNEATGGGIPGGPGGSSRPFIAVVCKAIYEPDLEASMDHLIEDLRVPAILSALNAPELKEMFNTKGQPNGVFFMSPLDADSTLTGLQDDGLLWHMLPEGRDLAPGYVAMVHAVEAWLRQERGLAATDPLKLALVDADTQFLLDISARLMNELTFNGGKTVGENRDNYHFQRLQTDSAAEVPNPDVSDVEDALFAFKPDIVVSVGSEESLEFIKNLDQGWAPSFGPKPFYVVSPWVFGRPELLDTALGDVPERMMGVNFAGAEDPTLYENFLEAIENEYEGVDQLGGKENFYDAAYYLMYAIAAAGDQGELTGTHIKAGLERLINPSASAQTFPVGRDAVPDALGFLSIPTSKIGLVGTMGEPIFNSSGARAGLPSYFCVDLEAGRIRIQDALRFDPTTQTVTGSQPCVATFPVPPP